MNEFEFSTVPFNIEISTNNAYRRWGFTVEQNDTQEQLKQITIDEGGNVVIHVLEQKEVEGMIRKS